jgi:hypothetical protein
MKIPKDIVGFVNNIGRALFSILIVGISIAIVGNVLHRQLDLIHQNEAVISKLKETDAGKFAVLFLMKCRNDNIFGKSVLECAKEVAEGAKALQGEEFAKEVGAALSKYIEAGEK